MKIFHIDCSLGVGAKTGIGYVTRVLLAIFYESGYECIIYYSQKEKNIEKTIKEILKTNKIPKNIKILKSKFKAFNLFSKYKLVSKDPENIFCPHQYPLLLNKNLTENNKLFFIVHDLCYRDKNYYHQLISFLKVRLLDKRIQKFSKFEKCTIFSPREATITRLKKEVLNKKEYKCSLKTLPYPYFYLQKLNRQKFKVSKYRNKKYILSISNIRGNKGINLYLEIVKKCPDVNFIYVGNLKKHKNFKETPNIKIIEEISDLDLFHLMLYSSAFLSTSTCEGLCIPVCRANALNIPTACRNLDIYQSDEFKSLHFIEVNNLDPTIKWLKSNTKSFREIKYPTKSDLDELDREKTSALKNIIKDI